MFPLFSNQPLATADDLVQMLERALRQIVDPQRNIVSVREKAFPELEELRIDLDGVRLRPDAPRPSSISPETTPALLVEKFELIGRGISVDEGRLDLEMRAENARFHQGRDGDGNIVLVLHAADSGRVNVSAAKADLENLISSLAKREAGRHAVAIEDLELQFNPSGPRAIDGMVRFRARKLFLSGIIRVGARLSVDEKLCACLSEISCAGDGTIGTLACNLLRPHLQRLDGRQVDLAALPIGDIALRDIEIIADDKLGITAQFGRLTSGQSGARAALGNVWGAHAARVPFAAARRKDLPQREHPASRRM